MTQELCGADLIKWQEILQVLTEAIEKRIKLWTAIEQLFVAELL